MALQDLTDMFASPDVESRIEAATYLLKQAADEQGVNLEDFSEDDLSEMLTDIATTGESDNDNGGGYDEGKTAGYGPSVAEVALEITKRAAYEGIDLSEFDADDYAEVFDKVAADMS